MAVTVTNGFGTMPLTMHVVLYMRLRGLAHKEWQRDVRPRSLPRRVFSIGRNTYVTNKVTEWMSHGICPYLTVTVTTPKEQAT